MAVRNVEAGILEGAVVTLYRMHCVYARVNEAQHIMDNAGYRPHPAWGLCSDPWCAFYHGCQVSGILGPDHVNFDSPALSLPLAPGAGEVERGPLSSAAPSPVHPSDV